MPNTRILIVEDDKLNTTYLEKVLQISGYQVTVVASGELAVQTAAADPPDVVLMDIMLPGKIDGIEAAAQIRANQDIPIVYLTAYADDELVDRIKATEPFGYLLKPFHEQELRIAIDMAIYKHKLETNLKETNHRLEQEITERKRAEEHLRKSEERFRRYFEMGTIGMAITSPEKGWVAANDQICQILGYPREELVKKTWAEITHPDDLDADVVQFNCLLNGEIEQYTMDKRFIRKDGQIVYANIGISCIRRADGSIDYVAGLLNDITDRKQAEEELQQSREQLRDLTARLSAVEETERRRFARELHDRVGQNLTALNINLSILQRQLPPELTITMSDRLNDSQDLIEETMEVIREMMAELRPSVLDDYGLLAALRWSGDLFAKRTGVPVAVQGKEFIPRLSMVIETALFRIAQEALTNVAKHAGATQVTIALDRDSEKIILSIMDDGIGFDPATFQSTAWGLMAMRERALAVDGRLDIASSPGNGTKIIVEIENCR